MSGLPRPGTGPLGRVSRRSGADWPGAPGVALVLAGGWLLSGPAGLLAGLAVAGLWLLVPAVYVVAAGQVLLVASTPGDPTPALLLPAEAGLLWLLLSTEVGRPDAGAVVAAAVVATAAGVGLVVWLAPAGVTWAALAVAALLVGGPVAGVGLDRLVERIEGGPPG